MSRWRREITQTPSCGQTRLAIKQRDNPVRSARWLRILRQRLEPSVTVQAVARPDVLTGIETAKLNSVDPQAISPIF